MDRFEFAFTAFRDILLGDDFSDERKVFLRNFINAPENPGEAEKHKRIMTRLQTDPKTHLSLVQKLYEVVEKEIKDLEDRKEKERLNNNKEDQQDNQGKEDQQDDQGEGEQQDNQGQDQQDNQGKDQQDNQGKDQQDNQGQDQQDNQPNKL